MWSNYGAEFINLDAADVENISGSTAYKHGVLAPQGGAVHPLLLAQGLALNANSRGANIFGQSCVDSMEFQGDCWQVDTQQGRVKSKWLVLATNGYTDGLYSNLGKSVVPLVPIQIATEPLAENVIKDILPGGETISDTRRVIMYGRREPDNRFIIGSLGYKQCNGEIGGFDWLARDTERVFPNLKGVDWKFTWGGQIAITIDHVPHFHEPAKQLVAGLGYNGRGVAMSNVMGRILAERILGKDAKDLPFPVTSIKAYPFHRFHQVGARSVAWWMKRQDAKELS